MKLKYYQKSFSYLLLIATLMSCGKKDHKETTVLTPDQRNLFQIGDEWGRRVLQDIKISTPDLFTQLLKSPIYGPAIYASGRSVGTFFYLGEYQGYHLMATNDHVVKKLGLFAGDSNKKSTIQFEDFGSGSLILPIKDHVVSWAELDFAIVVVDHTVEGFETRLKPYALQFEFEDDIYRDQPLFTVGYGFHKNTKRKLAISDDDDCRIFSSQNNFRFLSDPDTISPGKDKVWSMAHGCDLSHGDSGSAILDKNSGKVIGIVWTTATIENRQRGSDLLAHLSADSEEIWSHLSYGVPSKKIREYVERSISMHQTKYSEALKQLFEL